MEGILLLPAEHAPGGYLFSDSYYRYLEKTNGIFLFIPYETIKSFGTPVEDKEEIRCVYRGLFDDEASYAAIRDIASPKNAYPGSSVAKNFTINVFETIVRDAQSSIDLITIIVYGIFNLRRRRKTQRKHFPVEKSISGNKCTVLKHF